MAKEFHSSMTTFRPIVADDFPTMDDDAFAAAVSTLAVHIHAATWRLLVLIAELDRREVWAAQGALSCAHWLSWACGIDTHTAREKVRVARALGARRAHRLRPCADGRDGVMGFGRHPAGGGTGGRGLESVVGEVRQR